MYYNRRFLTSTPSSVDVRSLEAVTQSVNWTIQRQERTTRASVLGSRSPVHRHDGQPSFVVLPCQQQQHHQQWSLTWSGRRLAAARCSRWQRPATTNRRRRTHLITTTVTAINLSSDDNIVIDRGTVKLPHVVAASNYRPASG